MVEKVSELSIHEKEAVKREELIESPSVKSTSDEAPLLSKKNQQKYGEGSGISLMGIEEMEVKCAAYVRHDAFGTFGRGPFPLKEKILLGVAMLTLLPIRVVLALIILLLYYVVCKLCTCFSVAESEGEDGPAHYGHMSGFRRSVIVKAGRFLSRAMLFTFGFYWIKVNKLSGDDVSEENEVAPLESPVRPGAIISNHVSYLDILYHMADSFPSFVAKRSVAKLPLVGLISKCLGCVYVQRESKSSNFKGVSGIVAERLQAAHSNKDAPLMMLFPEGTTTNGDYLLPFKTGAFLAQTPVQPVILRYPYRRFSPAWDSISGARHVIFLLCQFVNHIEATRLPVYCPTDEEKADAKLYAENVRKLMALQGNLTMSDIGLPEKRIYHAALNGQHPEA